MTRLETLPSISPSRTVGRLDSLFQMRRHLLVVASAAILLLGTLPFQLALTNGPTVTLEPSSATVLGCGTTRVEIWVRDVTGLYGADIQFIFDPALLQVQDTDPNTEGVQIQPLSSFLKPDFVLKKKACNAIDPHDADCSTAGKVWYAVTQLSPSPAVSGSGPLVAVDFQGRGVGTTDLVISYRKLSDINGVEIPSSAIAGAASTQAPDVPDLAISQLNASTARLSWTAASGVAEYWLFREDAPYGTAEGSPYHTTTALSYDDVSAIGNPASNWYYVVRSACASGFDSAPSSEVAEFDFALEPGTGL